MSWSRSARVFSLAPSQGERTVVIDAELCRERDVTKFLAEVGRLLQQRFPAERLFLIHPFHHSGQDRSFPQIIETHSSSSTVCRRRPRSSAFSHRSAFSRCSGTMKTKSKLAASSSDDTIRPSSRWAAKSIGFEGF